MSLHRNSTWIAGFGFTDRVLRNDRFLPSALRRARFYGPVHQLRNHGLDLHGHSGHVNLRLYIPAPAQKLVRTDGLEPSTSRPQTGRSAIELRTEQNGPDATPADQAQSTPSAFACRMARSPCLAVIGCVSAFHAAVLKVGGTAQVASPSDFTPFDAPQ